MSVKSLVLALVIIVGLGLPALPSQAAHHEEGPAAAIVLIVDAGGKVEEFMGFLKRAEALAKKLDAAGNRRVYMNSFGGPQSGSIIVSIEFENIEELAKSNRKLTASPEWRQLAADLAATGIRVISNSIIQEMMP